MTLLDAAVRCDTRAIRRLVIRGLDAEAANERDALGRTALAYSCCNGNPTIVELLSCLPEVDPNVADNEGNTPLILAAQAGHRSCIVTLLNEFRNIDINAQNRSGVTALMQAAIQGRAECAKLLLAAGANPFKRDKLRGKSAFDWAKFCGRQCCAELIRKEQKGFVRLLRHFVTDSRVVSRRWGSDPTLAEDPFASNGNRTVPRPDDIEPKTKLGGSIRRSARKIRQVMTIGKRRSHAEFKCLDALVPASIGLGHTLVGSQFAKNELTYRKTLKGNQKGVIPTPPIPSINVTASDGSTRDPVQNYLDESDSEEEPAAAKRPPSDRRGSTGTCAPACISKR